MRDSAKSLVKLGQLAYLSSASNAARAEQDWAAALQKQSAEEAGLQSHQDQRNLLSEKLTVGGDARGLQVLLAWDHHLEQRVMHCTTRLEQAIRHQDRMQAAFSEKNTEAQKALARLRITENMQRRKERARRLQRERRQE